MAMATAVVLYSDVLLLILGLHCIYFDVHAMQLHYFVNYG